MTNIFLNVCTHTFLSGIPKPAISMGRKEKNGFTCRSAQ